MKINILQGAFLPVPGVRGGAIEKAWFDLGKEFSHLGHQVTHVSRLCDDLPPRETIDGVRHIRIKGSNPTGNPLLLKILEFPYVLRSRKYFSDADVLVTHAFWAPIIFPTKKFGKIYVHVGRYPKGQLKFYGKASRFQAPSVAIQDAISSEIPKRKKEVSVVPYPLPWCVSSEIDWNDRPKRILYIGRIHPEKGVLELLKAWNDLSIEDRKDWSLRIVGPWKKEQGGGGLEYFNKIKNEIGRKAAQVDYAGAIFDQKKLKAEYEQARIFAYPSLAEKGETFGLAVLEAMSCGCIPLVSSLACFEDFISPLDAYVFRIDEGRLKQELKKAIEGELSHEEKSGRAFEKSKEFELNTVALSYLKDFNRL